MIPPPRVFSVVPPRLSPGQAAVRLFLRAFQMSTLQAAGVVLLAHRSPYALVTAFLISFCWISAARDSVDYRHKGVRTAYGCGGMAGTGVVLLVAWWMS